MYESLKKYCDDFHLYIFAFDDKSYTILKKLHLSSVTVIPLSAFEDKELLKVKPVRSWSEYCWTCASSSILYVIKKYKVDVCTYLDADIYFFASPQILIDELGADSILITEHRYTPAYDQSSTSGKYCVQFITFKNNKEGLNVLTWWRKACLQWCYARFEDNKFGDQKYLDDWPKRFKGIHILQHLGGGVAPWNVQQYEFARIKNQIVGRDKITRRVFTLIFYHFHGLNIYNIFNFLPRIIPKGYFINKSIKRLIYQEYLNSIKSVIRQDDKSSYSPMPNFIYLMDYLYYYFVKNPYLYIKYQFKKTKTMII
ncbi:MAG: glycosyl transferase [bacterium]